MVKVLYYTFGNSLASHWEAFSLSLQNLTNQMYNLQNNKIKVSMVF